MNHYITTVNILITHRVLILHNIVTVNAFLTPCRRDAHILNKTVHCGRFKKPTKQDNQSASTASLRESFHRQSSRAVSWPTSDLHIKRYSPTKTVKFISAHLVQK